MKELGVGMVMRMAAKGLKPRLIISENGDKWTVRSESSVKTTSYDFTPGVTFDETTPDGREVKVSPLATKTPKTILFSSVDHQLRREQMGSYISGK